MTSTSTNNVAKADVTNGVLFAALAFTLWGVFPLYLKSVASVTALEILAHRILWSVPFGAALIAMRNQWPEVIKALKNRHIMMMLAVAAVSISANWLIYVWAVIHDRVLEASLGYYINPMMYVAAGVFILGEKLRPAQTAAVLLALIGVLILTLGAGVFPWVSITLALLFTAYGYIRKTIDVGAMPGLFVEVLLLSPIALLYLIWLSRTGNMMFLSGDIKLDILLILAGPATVLPLVLFALGTRRLRLTTMGFMQYIGPTLQFIIGIHYGETFTLFHALCFGLIWVAIGIFSVDNWRAGKTEKLAVDARKTSGKSQ